MSLVIDASTTATSVSNQTTAANTTSSFYAPSSPLLLTLWAADSVGGTGPAAPTISSSPSQTWTRDGWDFRDSGSPVVDGQAAIWHTVSSDAAESTTVTVTNQAASGFRDAAEMVVVLTGHDTTTPIGNTKSARQSSGSSVSDSVIATVTGSWGFMVLVDWNAGSTSAWATSSDQEIIDKGTTFGVSYAFIQRTSADGVASTAINFSVSGLVTGGQYHWVIVEVIPDLTLVNVTTVATELMLQPGQALF